MTDLEHFSRAAAKNYLQSIVFVDDEIYSNASGHPVVVTSELPLFKTPFTNTAVQQSPATETEIGTKTVPYHPKQLVESFAREGMVCALYEPVEDFKTEPTSELFKLCERADVVILDWDLFGQDGRNILPLLGNLVNQSQSSLPHHSRLCVIYTTKPDLTRVSGAIYDYLGKEGLTVEDVRDSTLIAGATRIIVLGKPNVPGRTEEAKALEVAEDKLADRVIEEFARMHRGILTSYALHGLASVRQNSKRILDKLHCDLDGAFLLHRALLIENEEAFEQIPELLAEEILAILLDNQLPADDVSQITADTASKLTLHGVTWPQVDKKTPAEIEQLARSFLGAGAAAIAGQYEVKMEDKKDRDLAKKLHTSMGCEKSNAEKKLASLFSLRTNYFGSQLPLLSFGTIVRWAADNGNDRTYAYALCLMPICDSVRLKGGKENRTSFPFWTLKTNRGGGSSRGIVVPTNEGAYVELYASGKPRDMLWIDLFSAAESGVVASERDGSEFFFSGNEKKRLEWVAQLKPAHAQRVAHDIGQSFSRVGVVEAEWVRLLTEGKS